MPKAKPKIAYLLTDWNMNEYRKNNNLYGGIGYYRVVKPAQHLKKWFDVDVIGADFRFWGNPEQAFTRLASTYDLIVSKHIDNGAAASNLLALANHFGKKVLVDVDDNYLALREDNPAYKDYAPLKGGRYFLGALMSLSDGLMVSTDPLKGAYTHLNKNIDVLPNCNDLKDWNFKKVTHDDKIRIGYAGGTAHNDDLELIFEPVARILDKYPNTRFEIMGAVAQADIPHFIQKLRKHSVRNIKNQIGFHSGTPAWEGYPELLNSKGWDIGLAPLIDDVFNRGKSHIKWMEYSVIGMPTIASPVYPYKEDIQGVHTIQDGKTGFFANNKDEWFETLEQLVLSEKLRKEIAGNAYKNVKENWQYKDHAIKWKEVLNKYL